MNEFKALVGAVLIEARKSKKKDKEEQPKVVKPDAYQYAEQLDFSNPLGGYNLYKSQGASNWGPMTGPGPQIDDNIRMPPQKINMGESVHPESAWSNLVESHESIWESALHWYDHMGVGLGEACSDKKNKKKKGMGFFPFQKKKKDK